MTKKKTITKSMKYRIKYDKNLYDILSDIQYKVFRIKNKSTSMAWDWQQFSFSYNERFGTYPKEKDVLGAVLTTDIYRELKHMGEDISSSTYNTAVKESVDKFKEQSGRVARGEESIVNYRRRGSFPIRANQIKNIERVNSKTYTAKLSLLSRKRVTELRKERDDKTIKGQLDVTLMTGRGANDIMDRIIEGEYKLCDSRISIDRKNRFFLSITYSFAPKEREKLDPSRIMGIDVGVAVPAYLAISDDGWYRQEVGDAREIFNSQKQMNSRMRAIQKSRKWAGDGSRGRGVKTRIKPIEKLSGRISRYKDHKNHVWSHYIVDEAVKKDCGVIQMEDLTGISENSKFLKTWTYYDLQTKIEYKAKEQGIEVRKVNPKHTSSRCNKCGNIHFKSEAKKWRPKQDQFKCMTCDWGHKFFVNADWNASLNIAMEDIENIIDEQLKAQKSVSV